MAAIDPNLLNAQWLQYQQSQLSQNAIIPQAVQAQYAPQYTQQYAPPQQQGELVSNETIAAMSQFVESSNTAAIAARQYIQYLQAQLATVDIGYLQLVEFSAQQDALLDLFIHDREFALQYARGAWVRDQVSDEFMSRLANVYLEIAALSPRGASPEQRDPQYTGNPNPAFVAQLQPTPQPQNFIPPLPSSSGNPNNGITMEQYLQAQQQGLVGAARAAAMQNPASLYASLFQ
jgi:hypothetical protein